MSNQRGVAQRGITLVELDKHASTFEKPYGIITADCSSPQEIDDGIFVEDLPTAEETYRVGVCVADTSKLYSDGDIFKQAMKNTEAKYWLLPGGEQGYDPMIDPRAIKGLEFKEGNIRDALMVSFIVGQNLPPSDVNVAFGKVEVVSNLNYKDFSRQCRSHEAGSRFGRASALIIRHLQYTSGGDYDKVPTDNSDTIYQSLVAGPRSGWLRGSRANEAYMVAANHLVGRLMADEERPAIYRIHDPRDETFLEFMESNVARYSWAPGKHAGLNLEPYCRVTSPLRRLEDFMMSYQLKQRYLGRMATNKDAKDIVNAVRKLNWQIITGDSQNYTNLSLRETTASITSLENRDLSDGARVIPIRENMPKTAAM